MPLMYDVYCLQILQPRRRLGESHRRTCAGGGSMSKPERAAGLRSNVRQMSVKTRQMSGRCPSKLVKCPSNADAKHFCNTRTTI